MTFRQRGVITNDWINDDPGPAEGEDAHAHQDVQEPLTEGGQIRGVADIDVPGQQVSKPFHPAMLWNLVKIIPAFTDEMITKRVEKAENLNAWIRQQSKKVLTKALPISTQTDDILRCGDRK